MNLTKPAGVAFQLIGASLIFFAIGIVALSGSWAAAILFLVLGGWMFFQGGKRARQKTGFPPSRE